MTARTGEREWRAGRPVELRATLGGLVRGPGDPAHRFDAGRFWWACGTPHGDGTLALSVRGATVSAAAWGAGAEWLLARVPVLLGADDDWTRVDVTRHPLLHRVQRAHPGLRLCATGRLLDALVPAVLEQKVTGREARRSWRALLRWYGSAAPGPTPVPMRVPPPASVLREIPTWDWHRMGVDLKRQRTIRAAASVADRLEECVSLSPADALARLRYVPGVGEWTAAETAQRALGHPDAISVGDYHLKHWVVHAMTGRPRGSDAEMLDLLAPWAGQRQRVVRLIELSGLAAPRFGPRFAPNDIRAI
jgi:3-methyladenine DNA glycosylase/8-oxoguanine DNA glycosylase